MSRKLLLGLFFLSACGAPIVSRAPVNLTQSQVTQVEEAVKFQLIDPESASFRSIGAAQLIDEDGRQQTFVCGAVNSRNRMGGFAGFVAFYGSLSDQGQFTVGNIDSYDSSFSSSFCAIQVGVVVR